MNKNNHSGHGKKLWFKRRRYGYGWVPVAWQGYVILLSYIAAAVALSLLLLQDVPNDTYQAEVGVFIGIMLLSPLLLWLSIRNHAPKPSWRWGSKPTDDPEQDW